MPHRYPSEIAAPTPAAGRTWLTNARLFDATGTAVRENAAVLLEDGVVAQVALEPDLGDDQPTIDLGGRTLLPGLTNAHLHVSGAKVQPAHGAEPILDGTPAHFLQAALRDCLRMGVTTMRDAGSQGQQPQEARQAMRYGAFRGPRLLTCAKIVSATAPGGRFYGTMYREADGEDDVRRAVREQVRAGADYVKVMTTGARSNELEDPTPLQLTRAELAALVDESHRLGYRVAAHAEGLPGTEASIDLGIDTIEHGMFLNQRPDLLEKMAHNGQVLVPTLTGYYWMAGLGDTIDPTDGTPDPDMPPMLVELANHNLQQGGLTVKAAKEAGVKIAAGSDGGTQPKHMALELLRMIHFGLTAEEALIAATRTAAEALGLDERLGTIEVGKLADLVVIDGDPLSDPSLLTDRDRIWLVIQLGEPVAGAALEARVHSGTSAELLSPQSS
jgi:imidazolonepropionase-like amidohydrolase